MIACFDLLTYVWMTVKAFQKQLMILNRPLQIPSIAKKNVKLKMRLDELKWVVAAVLAVIAMAADVTVAVVTAMVAEDSAVMVAVAKAVAVLEVDVMKVRALILVATIAITSNS